MVKLMEREEEKMEKKEEKLPARRSKSVAAPFFESPFLFMRKFSEEMDRLFDSFFDNFGMGRSWLQPRPWSRELEGGVWYPPVEAFERDNKLVVRCELPGLKKDDINVEVREDSLVISGERKEERHEEREGFYRSERSYGSFHRAVPLPRGTKSDQAKASFKDGVLEISIPTEQPMSGRRIAIQS
ncbi:MAG: Hsp20/alpha crystallin family protein [Acidobacteria bacterium]|nr:Hsp20/alpha crystallin family protein [Acidobacteriota bacterium]